MDFICTIIETLEHDDQVWCFATMLAIWSVPVAKGSMGRYISHNCPFIFIFESHTQDHHCLSILIFESHTQDLEAVKLSKKNLTMATPGPKLDGGEVGLSTHQRNKVQGRHCLREEPKQRSVDVMTRNNKERYMGTSTILFEGRIDPLLEVTAYHESLCLCKVQKSGA